MTFCRRNKDKKLNKNSRELMTKLDIIEKEKVKLIKYRLEFYDIIINIDYFHNIGKKGWKIVMNEKEKNMIDSKKRKNW